MSAAATLYGPIRKITVEEFMRMVDLGMFGEDEKVELVDGVIVEVSPQGVRHSMCVSRVTKWLFSAAGSEYTILVQQPVSLGTYSLREPDIAVVKGAPAEYDAAGQHPGGSDVPLVIEVADSSVSDDTRRKHLLYAAAGIREFWVVNIPSRRLEIHTEPSAHGYGVIHIVDEFHTVAPGVFPEATIEVGKLLPNKS